jgi:glycosyltransferase involved in cell wall biosynthesis
MGDPRSRSDGPRSAGTIVYVLKGFPRRSETFIASEIHRLEQEGLPLRLVVIKQDESYRHPVVDRIRAKPEYLPASGTLAEQSLARWLLRYGRGFVREVLRALSRRPVGFSRAALAALAQAWRSRRTFWSLPRALLLKEFLLASALANRVLDDPGAVHLHAHFCHGATTVAWLASRITGIPYSFTAHAKDTYCESLNPAGLLRRKIEAARFVVTCTDAARRRLEALSSATPIHRVYHGLNADFARLVRHGIETSADGELFRILGVGRLVPKKGFDVLVRACALLRQAGLPFEACIVGEAGSHESEVRRLIAHLRLLDAVRLLGPMGQQDLFAEYRRASVFCLPCRVAEDGDRDGIPNVLLEAMACGLPVVTTGISGIPELIADGRNGFLVRPDDPAALASAMSRIQDDPEAARRLAREARTTVLERFDGDRLARGLADLFREVLP